MAQGCVVSRNRRVGGDDGEDETMHLYPKGSLLAGPGSLKRTGVATTGSSILLRASAHGTLRTLAS